MRMGRNVASVLVVSASVAIAGLLVVSTIFAQTNISSSVVVGTAAPVVSGGVSVNGGNPITLTANTTTNVNVVATITDANGCSEITAGTTTVLLYRSGSGVSSSTCASAQNPLYCYKAVAFTASSTCSAGTQNTTTTFAVQYFAQATDSSSSFSGQKWVATVNFTTPDNTTGTADSSPGVTLNTLTSINVTPLSINYGTITANTDTGSTNQSTTVANAGNSSTSLQVYSSLILTSGANNIPVGDQGYATSPFTYPTGSTAMTGSLSTVAGFLLTSPTSTTNVTSTLYWGLLVPNDTPAGTYGGTNVFAALFHA